MLFKKKFFLLTLFLIVIFQTLLYTNNNQKTSFRYFKWTFQEISIGKLISISFLSGLFISTLIISTNTEFKKKSFENIDENYHPHNNEEDMKSDVDMPPQRDIRESRPTISVNYRVIKNSKEKNLKSDQNYSNGYDNKDDWTNNDNDW